MRTHRGEKPNSCEVCGSAFLCKSHLVNYMWTHRGEKPYSCEVCGLAFSRKSHLVNHTLVFNVFNDYFNVLLITGIHWYRRRTNQFCKIILLSWYQILLKICQPTLAVIHILVKCVALHFRKNQTWRSIWKSTQKGNLFLATLVTRPFGTNQIWRGISVRSQERGDIRARCVACCLQKTQI